jgi:hypothetical protein
MSNKQVKLEDFDPSEGQASRKVNMVTIAHLVADRIDLKVPTTTDNSYENKIKFTWAPTELCWVNYERQRFPIPLHIKKVKVNWNLLCATPLQARYSKIENRYYIADGQQHGIAWILKYGPGSMLPVAYFESEDENDESTVFVIGNGVRKSVAPYFIHNQQVMMGDKDAVALENAVTKAKCSIEHKKRSAGCITNMGHLYAARSTFKLPELTAVLSKMKLYWPTKRIETNTMRGLLQVRKMMKSSKTFSDAAFDDILLTLKGRYVDGKGIPDLGVFFDAVQTQIKKQIGTTSMDAESKLSSAILSVYEQLKNVDVVNGRRPYKELKMPLVIVKKAPAKKIITAKRKVA